MISSPTFTGRWACGDHSVMLCEKSKLMAIIDYLPDLPVPKWCPDGARCAKAGLHLRHVNERHGDGGASADFDGGLLSAWWFWWSVIPPMRLRPSNSAWPRSFASQWRSQAVSNSFCFTVVKSAIASSHQNGTSHSLRSCMSCDMLIML